VPAGWLPRDDEPPSAPLVPPQPAAAIVAMATSDAAIDQRRTRPGDRRNLSIDI
jgi:hypothetical protein